MKIECIQCNNKSSLSDWNSNTEKYCEGKITKIEFVAGEDVETFFYCPNCNTEIYAVDLKIEIGENNDK